MVFESRRKTSIADRLSTPNGFRQREIACFALRRFTYSLVDRLQHPFWPVCFTHSLSSFSLCFFVCAELPVHDSRALRRDQQRALPTRRRRIPHLFRLRQHRQNMVSSCFACACCARLSCLNFACELSCSKCRAAAVRFASDLCSTVAECR